MAYSYNYFNKDSGYSASNPYGLKGDRLKQFQNNGMGSPFDPTESETQGYLAYRFGDNAPKVSDWQKMQNAAAFGAGMPQESERYRDDQKYQSISGMGEDKAPNRAPVELTPLDKMRQSLQSSADKFHANKGLLGNQMFESFASGERRALSDRLVKANEGASRRGLLYSGINEGNKAALRGESAQSMASTRAGINKGLDQADLQMQQNAAKADLQSVDMTQSLEDAIYSNALESMKLRNAGIQSFLGGIGMLGGAYMGGAFGKFGGGGSAGIGGSVGSQYGGGVGAGIGGVP